MNLIIFEESTEEAFEKASLIEEQYHDGDWLYFEARKNKMLGLYETSKEPRDFCFLTPDENFLKHFLGLFTPSLNKEVSVVSFESFTDFCVGLNQSLRNGSKIFDCSRKSFWLWTNENANQSIPKKLLQHLSVN